VTESPYLTAAEAAVYLRYRSVKALYGAVRDGHIPRWVWSRRGGALLFHKAFIEQWLHPEHERKVG